jgi:hypothetical protein
MNEVCCTTLKMTRFVLTWKKTTFFKRLQRTKEKKIINLKKSFEIAITESLEFEDHCGTAQFSSDLNTSLQYELLVSGVRVTGRIRHSVTFVTCYILSRLKTSTLVTHLFSSHFPKTTYSVHFRHVPFSTGWVTRCGCKNLLKVSKTVSTRYSLESTQNTAGKV